MKSLITGDDKYNEMKLLRDSFRGAILLLEGSTDCSVMDNFVNPADCRTIPGITKQNVLDAISLAEKRGMPGVLGLVDADFDRLEKTLPTSQNVCVTDVHDLDLTILLSGVLERLLRQYCDEVKHSAFLKSAGKDSLLLVLVESACLIGILKWLSEKQRLSLNFQSLNFALFIDRNSLSVIRSELIRAAIDNTKNCRATASSVVGDMNTLAAKKPDPKQVANGHDVVEILSMALRFAIAQCKPDVAEPRNIEKMCRMAFAASDLQTTGIYVYIKSWESRNTPYKILKV